MHLTTQAQAVMLLAVSFGKSDSAGAKPLSNGEWARFSVWLKDHDLEPASLLKGNVQSLLAGWIDRSVSVPRIQALLDRGAALGLAIERWQRAGLWVLTRSDPDYPERLKRRLRSGSPAVLFGCGNKSLLNCGGIAVVGSRDAGEEDLFFAERLGSNAAAQGHPVISGGARGVDLNAMRGALDSGGTAAGVLADSLLRSATSVIYRKPIMSGDLALVSPVNPETGFNVGNAMMRNQYIYCLADAAVVVSSTRDKGGTWTGALESLKAAWVPLWVKPSANPASGNPELVRRGANWLPGDLGTLEALLASSPPTREMRPDLPLLASERPSASASATETPQKQSRSSETAEGAPPSSQHRAEMDFSLFLSRMHDITAVAAMTTDAIAARLGLHKAPLNAWLKRGVGEGKIKKLTRPVRYQSASAGQQSLFGDDA
jgi:predicted Rossmann fold nucleotide-binding protein DprA/Smf involved in DNA uptake